MSRITTLRLAALVAATGLALASAPASAGGFHRGGFKGFHGHYGHGFKHVGYTGFYGGKGFHGGGCFWTFNGFKKVKVCY
jgi:hypothetical protein